MVSKSGQWIHETTLKNRNRRKPFQAFYTQSPQKSKGSLNVNYMEKQWVSRIAVKIINGTSVSCVIHRGCLEDEKEARTAPTDLAKGLSLLSAGKRMPLFQGRAGERAALSHRSSVTTTRKTTPRPAALPRSQEQHPHTATTGHCSPATQNVESQRHSPWLK